MEDSEYKTIEEQALQIVGTLNRLKEEIEGYKGAKIETQKSLDSLDALLGGVTEATQQLSGVAKDIRESDYTSLHAKMSQEAEVLTSACETLQKNLEEVPSKVETMLELHRAKQEELQSAFAAQIKKALEAQQAKQGERNEELLDRITTLEAAIARIDRNTQKGLFKERG